MVDAYKTLLYVVYLLFIQINIKNKPWKRRRRKTCLLCLRLCFYFLAYNIITTYYLRELNIYCKCKDTKTHSD